MKATYKVHTDPTCNSLTEVSFEQALEIKGRKTFRKTPSQERAARARIDRDKFFKGVVNPYSKADTGRERLEDFVAANDIPGYVAAWRKLNNLTN